LKRNASQIGKTPREVDSFLSSPSLLIVVGSFLVLAALNVTTYFIGPAAVLSHLQTDALGSFLANFVFDSPGTVAGLLGAIILFLPILLGTPATERKSLSVYFISASLVIGVGASLIWDDFLSGSGSLSYGSSSIDIAAQSTIFTLSISSLVRSFSKKQVAIQTDSYVRNCFRIIYLTLIVTTLWFVISLEPVFVPTALYNWRVHEIAFLGGIIFMTVYLASVNFRLIAKDSRAVRANPLEAGTV